MSPRCSVYILINVPTCFLNLKCLTNNQKSLFFFVVLPVEFSNFMFSIDFFTQTDFYQDFSVLKHHLFDSVNPCIQPQGTVFIDY